jgi:hypothetical protein
VVVGGLVTSTLITLVFIPVVYFTVEGWRQQARERRSRPDTMLEPAASAGD